MINMNAKLTSHPLDRPSGPKSRRSVTEVRIRANSLFRLPGDHRGERIDVLAGIVWITQPGDAADHLLKRGDSLPITHPGMVVAQGISESQLQVVSQE
jgi:hypothetical protein